MKFLADESLEYWVVEWLRGEGYDVVAIADELRSIDDVQVLKLADKGKRILLTNDKDFGELVFRQKFGHAGVILFRLPDDKAESKIEKLEELLKKFGDGLAGRFVVVSQTRVRLT